MKIIKYQKKNNDAYLLTLENNEKIILHTNTILKYELLINKEIPPYLLNEILASDNKEKAYLVALKYLQIKMRSIKELKNHLKGYPDDLVSEIVKRLCNEGYLNDLNYTKSYINDKVYLNYWGPQRIKNNLLREEIDESVIVNELEKVNIETWQDNARKIVNKKLKTINKGSKKMVLLKIMQELRSLGYDEDIISYSLSNIEFNDEKNLEKDLLSLKKKYEKEGIDKSKRIKIISKLVSKGYSYEDIISLYDK